jgi:hypothetical protein
VATSIIHWREQLIEHADKIYSIDNVDDMDSLFATPIDPDNPLVYASTRPS